MATPNRLRCGEQLKTTTCSRSAWWPGGKCPQHGYGATTFEEWARGMAAAEAAPDGAKLFVSTSHDADNGVSIIWHVAGWVSRKWKQYAHGTLTIEEASTVGDQLAAEGVLDEHEHAMVGNAIAIVLREQLRLRGDTARADAVALALRKLGLTASAVDNYVVLPLADAEALVAQFKILD